MIMKFTWKFATYFLLEGVLEGVLISYRHVFDIYNTP